MKRRLIPLVLVALALFALLAAYATDRTNGAPAPATAASAADPANTVDFEGVRGVRLGQSEAELTRQGTMSRPADACGPTLTNVSEASPVVANGELVLLWVNPPLTTPEGVGVGTSLATAKAAYPQATTLDAPPGSYQFDGLMVTNGDRAYLFMHDGTTVRKTVVGFTDQVRLLFTEGVGSC